LPSSRPTRPDQLSIDPPRRLFEELADTPDRALGRASRQLREAAWELALLVVHEALADGSVPSLTRVEALDRLGQLPAFIGELGRQVADPHMRRLGPDPRVAEVAREHARHREALGFAPREVVTELLVLRRVLWRFLTQPAAHLDEGGLIVAERRLHETLDAIVVECVAGYFERATAELSDRARRDPLTRLLNREAFWSELDRELDRARRFGHGLSFVFADLDWFKEVNDTRGHAVGDQVLQALAESLTSISRGSDLAARMGGDEFAAALVETNVDAGPRFAARVGQSLRDRTAHLQLEQAVTFSAGTAHFPTEADSAPKLFELADERLYEQKRSRDT
jgi:diguanylate cyclase (GGDEF)-like protein